MFTKEQLKEQMRQMGLKSTDTVLIHTSMKAVGEVENGADGLIDAFCEYLSDGLFLVPTHTWASIWKEKPRYDVNKEVPCVGIVPIRAAFRPDGIRSLHPTHSVWAHGADAEEFVRGEEKATSPGQPGFLWSRLPSRQTKILLIGVTNARNTFIHAVEELADIPDRLGEPYDTVLVDRDGKEYPGKMCGHKCSRTNDVSQFFVNFEKPMVELGAQTFGKLGNAQVRIVDAQKCQDVVLRCSARADRDLCVELLDIPAEWYREEA